MAREIEEDQFAHYVKLDVKKIEAVHGLDQLVSQSQIKKERGQYVRQKFEDLRALLGRRLMDEKKIVGECEDFVDQLKRGKEELRKLLKASEGDAVALELVKEDAEQADSEANLARQLLHLWKLMMHLKIVWLADKRAILHTLFAWRGSKTCFWSLLS